MSVEILMGKAILMTPPMNMRSLLLENGKKEILVIKLQRRWLNCVRVLVFVEGGGLGKLDL